MLNLILTTIEQGLIFAILAMGVSFTYKILDLPDLSVEGSFPFGAFIFVKLSSMGINPFVSTFLSFCFASLAGVLTSQLFIKLKIQPILAGILTMTILYTVNLRLNGQSNIPLFDEPTIFLGRNKLVILLILTFLIKFIIDYFLKTEIGYLLIVTGDNENLTNSLGFDSNNFKMLGFILANGLIGFSGAIMAQYQGFADISMGYSIIVIALASIIIGDTVLKNKKIKTTSKIIIGSILYQLIGSIAIDLGLNPDDLKAVNALILILFIAYNNIYIPKKRMVTKDA